VPFPREAPALARIVLTTFGSLGDLHPYLALGVELRARGHVVVLATHAAYREEARAAGLEFAPVRPDLDDLGDRNRIMRQAMDMRTGSEFVLRRFVLEPLRASTADLLAACADADLVVSHVLSLAAVLAAEKLGVPRVHSVLQPLAMWSASDPPVMPALPGSAWLARTLPTPGWRLLWAAAGAWTKRWFGTVHALRRELGLPPSSRHPVFEMWSPLLNLALFSPLIAPPQPDWPPRTLATGFPEWTSTLGWNDALQAFLDAGEPPIVFTLGSSAVHTANAFWEHSARAAAQLGRRAVLLTGIDVEHELSAGARTAQLLAVEYAPHARLFPRAAAIVHQGGIGTTARALASGRPMLVVPYSHDQPDNAARCERLGVARTLARDRYRADRAAAALAALLADGALARRAAEAGAAIAVERGAATAADALEGALRGRLVSPAGRA
jgi:UDP:flavonoid glycosyltransferase YjiC (YdhE family)